MARLINRWTMLCAWAILMGIVWALFVPRGMSVTAFTLLSLTGAVFMIAAWALWSTHQPTPSIRQTRAALEAAEGAARTQR